MSDMTPEAAAKLREKFPASAIGKLPKPYKSDSQKGQCRECNGYHGLPAVHLDYVGHAATTDRLLAVDPLWTWEPFALDDNGLPALDRSGNLWIKLTVCGVTRLGVGDGKSAKECIGDAIRNAAMRFGVALDLWSKEELEGGHAEQAPPTREAHRQAAMGVDPQRDSGDMLRSDAQSKKLFTVAGKVGLKDRDDLMPFIAMKIGREVDSTKNLTRAEANAVIEALERAQADSVNIATGEVSK